METTTEESGSRSPRFSLVAKTKNGWLLGSCMDTSLALMSPWFVMFSWNEVTNPSSNSSRSNSVGVTDTTGMGM